jgi:CDP-diacylglycerol--serine O-phosphatidyltransferase
MISIPPVRYILPNLFTLGSAFCGFALIWLAFSATEAADFYRAAALIPLACFLDGFDGRVARMVKGESRFGAQLDSLSDFATFGVAPAFLVYVWALQPLGTAGLIVAFIFASASMIRLARFNVAAEEDVHGPPARYFQGLPAPMGGNAIASIVAFEAGFLGRDESPASAQLAIVALVLLLAMLMVSNVPFRTFKDVRMTPLNRLFVVGAITGTLGLSLLVDFMFAVSVGLAAYIGLTLSTAVVRSTRTRVARAAHARHVARGDHFSDFDNEDD